MSNTTKTPKTPKTAAQQLAAPLSYRAIMTLRDEAATHGDLAMVATCDLALRGSKSAIRVCAMVIADAAAASADR